MKIKKSSCWLRGDLKKPGLYHKELVAFAEVSGSLAGTIKISIGVLFAISLLLLVNHSFSEATEKTEEWVPFQTILTRFGLQEAMRRAPWQQYPLHILHSTL